MQFQFDFKIEKMRNEWNIKKKYALELNWTYMRHVLIFIKIDVL